MAGLFMNGGEVLPLSLGVYDLWVNCCQLPLLKTENPHLSV